MPPFIYWNIRMVDSNKVSLKRAQKWLGGQTSFKQLHRHVSIKKKSSGESEKKSLHLKVKSEDAFWTSAGRVFHSIGIAVLNGWLVAEAIRDFVTWEQLTALLWMISVKALGYKGAGVPFITGAMRKKVCVHNKGWKKYRFLYILWHSCNQKPSLW